jgi:hypothetical protein
MLFRRGKVTRKKKIRKILEKQQVLYIPHNMVKYSANVEIIVSLEDSVTLNSLRGLAFLDNDTSVEAAYAPG